MITRSANGSLSLLCRESLILIMRALLPARPTCESLTSHVSSSVFLFRSDAFTRHQRFRLKAVLKLLWRVNSWNAGKERRGDRAR
jgi:hypothetical protein